MIVLLMKKGRSGGKLMNDMQLDPKIAMQQCATSASEYLNEAYEILKDERNKKQKEVG